MASTINATTNSGVQVSGDNSGVLQLQTNSGTTAITIDTSQNVGIGTSSPVAKFEVQGGARIGTAVSTSYVRVSHDTANGLVDTNVGSLGYAVPSSQIHYWAIGGTERMRITATGGVAIGTTTDPGAGKISATGGWAGTTSSAGLLGGTALSFACERSGVGTVGNIMSFGNGLATGKGIRMPFAGKIYAFTLSGTGINGTVTVQLAINGSGNASYQLTQTNGVAGDVGQTGSYLASPLSFSAGDTVGVYQAAVPSAANGYTCTFYVVFN